MAGAGRRTFTPGEVLTASNVMNYLQDQAVMAFAGTAARGSAIGTAVSEGMVSYLSDNNFLQAHDGSGWRSLGGVQVASGTATRDALLPSPIQGDTVFRNDLGFEQTYYSAYNSSTNPGGRVSAGWYSGQSGALVPIIPSSINVSTGTATVTGNGTINIPSGTTYVGLNGIFSNQYSAYCLFYSGQIGTNNGFAIRFRNGGTDNSSNVYQNTNYYWGNSGTGGSNFTGTYIGGIFGHTDQSYEATFFNPFQTDYTHFIGQGTGRRTGSYEVHRDTATFDATSSFDGINFYLLSGATWTKGKLNIFGVRE